ncbi:MAG: hypothetical protein M3N53_00255 [Actinomycetota bacterium]|nr:hypothetical protein [Actinomycetota bacterium]
MLKIMMTLLVGMSSAAIATPAAAVEPPLEVSLPGQLVVVTANLQELNAEDLQNMEEMEIFVKRLLQQVPHFPDVLLLQEVERTATLKVVRELTAATGETYRLGVALPREWWRATDSGKRYVTETAIVINTNTIDKQSKGGWIATPDPYQKLSNVYRRQAHVALKETQSGTAFAVSSVHLPYAKKVNGFTDAEQTKFRRWTDAIASKLQNKYPGRVRMMGGDFNQGRCNVFPCEETEFWKLLTRRYGYKDTTYEYNQRLEWYDRLKDGVDFIFTTSANVIDAGVDDSKNVYSNHRFRWSLVTSG